MSELTTFRDHARRMATAEHKPECPGWVRHPDLLVIRGVAQRVACPGCIPDADRALWARLAAEVDAYLSHDEEAMLL